MDIGGVREALHRVPFQPFELRLADGRAVRIAHPDFVALGARRIVVVGEDDSTSIIEPLLIVSIDTLSANGQGGNGSQKKKPKR